MSHMGPNSTINWWVNEVHSLAVDKGWHEEPLVAQNATGELGVDVNGVAAKLMLIVSELSEALEELRADPSRIRETYHSADGKPEGFPVELADAAIRIMDLAGALKVDLGSAMMNKHLYNITRPRRHGGKAL